MIFFDCEVFAYDWLLVAFDGKEFTYIENDRELLQQFYNKHKKDLWIGYNCKGYDQYVVKAILLGINPKIVNDYIIRGGHPGWSFTNKFRSIKLNIYDCMVFSKSLKQLESYMGVNIHETDVDFDLKRPLTTEERKLNREYCRDDVYNTALVFQNTKDSFDARFGLCQVAGEPLSSMAKTQAQLAAKILKAKKLGPTEWDQEFDFEYVQCVKDYSYKHKEVIEFFDSIRESKDASASLDIDLYGTEHTFALGGLHGALPNYMWTADDETKMVHADVGSMYPTIMIEWGLLSRAIPDPKLYVEIREQRLKYKKEGNSLQQPLKLVLNSTYGMSGAGKRDADNKYKVMSDVFDPKRMREVCINGQLMILQLIEDVCEVCNCTLVQSNTDGVVFKVKNEDWDTFDKIVKTWEQRTRMTMEYDYTNAIYQRDVNNYIAIFDNGKIERKGGAVKEAKITDNDLPVVADAVVEYFVNGVDPAEYISKESDMMRYMKTYKLSYKYDGAMHNDVVLTDKVYRVFASLDENDGIVYKFKTGKNPEKFASCPEHAKIVNTNIQGKKVPEWLDKQFYIDMAWDRIKSFKGCK